MYFAQCSFTEMKITFIKPQNESSLKDIGQLLRQTYEIAKLWPVTLKTAEILKVSTRFDIWGFVQIPRNLGVFAS